MSIKASLQSKISVSDSHILRFSKKGSEMKGPLKRWLIGSSVSLFVAGISLAPAQAYTTNQLDGVITNDIIDCTTTNLASGGTVLKLIRNTTTSELRDSVTPWSITVPVTFSSDEGEFDFERCSYKLEIFNAFADAIVSSSVANPDMIGPSHSTELTVDFDPVLPEYMTDGEEIEYGLIVSIKGTQKFATEAF